MLVMRFVKEAAHCRPFCSILCNCNLSRFRLWSASIQRHTVVSVRHSFAANAPHKSFL
jgi:hypothetical protein